ncbi:MAG TPA: hypothetical protein VLE70_17205 [Anaerolineae bacterium]|jgi:hypothetical protein|nr:hypothetical protein [Anaerolineae bacterium]
MAHKFWFLSLVAIVILPAIAFFPDLVAEITLAQEVEIDQAARQRILEVTIKIRMISLTEPGNNQFAGDNGGSPQDEIMFGYGLGTLAKINGETVIITHDHWNLLSDPQTVILISSLVDDMKLVISRNEFVNRIRYRDGGTMIVDAPAQLAARSSLAPELAAAGELAVQPGDNLYIVHRQLEVNDALTVEPVALKSVDKSEAPSSLTLQSINGIAVGPGNSGGGVWHDGQLVANIWSAVLCRAGGLAVAAYQPTNLSQAAQIPFLPSS